MTGGGGLESWMSAYRRMMLAMSAWLRRHAWSAPLHWVCGSFARSLPTCAARSRMCGLQLERVGVWRDPALPRVHVGGFWGPGLLPVRDRLPAAARRHGWLALLGALAASVWSFVLLDPTLLVVLLLALMKLPC